MKKALPIIIIALLVGIGAYYFLSKGQPDSADSEQPKDTGGLKVLEDSSLLGWLKRGKSVECVLSTAEGSMTVKARGEDVRIDGIPYGFGENAANLTTGSSITTGGWVYYWSGQEGVKFNLAKEEAANAQEIEEDETGEVSWEDWAESMEDEGVSYDCAEKSFSSDLFIPPDDVNFIDFSQTVSDMQALSEEALKDIEEGGLEDMDIEELEAKLKDIDVDQLMEDSGVETE